MNRNNDKEVEVIKILSELKETVGDKINPIMDYMRTASLNAENDGFVFPGHKPFIPVWILMYLLQDDVELMDLDGNRFKICATCEAGAIPKHISRLPIVRVWSLGDVTQIAINYRFTDEDKKNYKPFHTNSDYGIEFKYDRKG